MYYILNKANQLIGADKKFLELCQVTTIEELFTKVIKEEINLTITQENITINNKKISIESSSTITTLLGDLYLSTLSNTLLNENEEDKELIIDNKPTEGELDLDIFNTSDDTTTIDTNKDEDELDLELFTEDNQEKDEPKELKAKEDSVEDELDLDLNIFDTSDDTATIDTNKDEDELDLELFTENHQEKDEPKELKAKEDSVEDELDLDLNIFDTSDDTATIDTNKDENKDEVELDLDNLELFTQNSEEKDEPKELKAKEDTVEDELDLDLDIFDTSDDTATIDTNKDENKDEVELDLDNLELFTQNSEEKDEPKELKAKDENKDEVELDLDNLELFTQNSEEKDEPKELKVEDEIDSEILDLFGENEYIQKKFEPINIDNIEIDIPTISQSMGFSEDDYKEFLDEFINTANEVKDDLKGNDADKITEAVTTLSNLSEILHLPFMKDILNSIEVNNKEKDESIELLFKAISKIEKLVIKEEVNELEPLEEIKLEPDTEVKSITKEEKKEEIQAPTKGFGTIDLSEVKAKHFDFQLEAAANDLSLPVELIEEFVHDFIEQAHEETPKMLKAYEEGDLDTIQKIGHLLKGASSNLRINPLADTLYKIQFCEQPSQLDILIKDYWAHFMSLENQIKVISN